MIPIMTFKQATGFFEDLAYSEMSAEYVIDRLLHFLASLEARINADPIETQDFLNDLQRYVYGEMSLHGRDQREKYVQNIVERLRTFNYEKTGRANAEETVLDLSNHSTKEGECLDIAKTVNDAIANPETDEETRERLKLMIDEMVSGGLPEYSPQIVEAFMCAPVNDVWCKSFERELKGEDY